MGNFASCFKSQGPSYDNELETKTEDMVVAEAEAETSCTEDIFEEERISSVNKAPVYRRMFYCSNSDSSENGVLWKKFYESIDFVPKQCSLEQNDNTKARMNDISLEKVDGLDGSPTRQGTVNPMKDSSSSVGDLNDARSLSGGSSAEDSCHFSNQKSQEDTDIGTRVTTSGDTNSKDVFVQEPGARSASFIHNRAVIFNKLEPKYSRHDVAMEQLGLLDMLPDSLKSSQDVVSKWIRHFEALSNRTVKGLIKRDDASSHAIPEPVSGCDSSRSTISPRRLEDLDMSCRKVQLRK